MIILSETAMMTIELHVQLINKSYCMQKLTHTITDKMRRTKLFSVSIGSYECHTMSSRNIQIYLHMAESKVSNIHTSIKHDNSILPTIPPSEVGSNKSYTPTSESESCKIISMRIKWRIKQRGGNTTLTDTLNIN